MNCTDTVGSASTSVPESPNPAPHPEDAGFLRVEDSVAGTAVFTPEGIDSQITASEAAQLCGVALCTITKWVRESRIQPVGINRQGRKVYKLLDVAKAERATRDRARR